MPVDDQFRNLFGPHVVSVLYKASSQISAKSWQGFLETFKHKLSVVLRT